MNMKSKTILTAIAIFLMVSIAASTILTAPVKGDGTVSALPGINAGDVVTTYLYLNVAPNPIGVGQQVNVNAFFGAAIIDNEAPLNYTVTITSPNGNTETRKLTADTTGGGYITFVPSVVGEYKFQAFYGGQTMVKSGYVGLKQGPANSSVKTLTVQEDPITQRSYPFTPLPNNWWENPVSAQNTQNWYKIMGPWLIPGRFNATSYGNPYTESVTSGHVLWTYPWGGGGVVGGNAGGGETNGQYWTARQYEPQFTPLVISGKMYAQWYADCTGYSNGILCIDLKTGATLYRINTTSTLLCGMVTSYNTPNAYGSIGPYIWTTGSLTPAETGGSFVYSTGTQFNLYSCTTGQYVMSIVNGTSLQGLHEDVNGNLLGYYINSTVGTMTFWNDAWYQLSYDPITGASGPQVPLLNSTLTIASGDRYLCEFNFTKALWNSAGNNWEWTQRLNQVLNFNLGCTWAEKIPTTLDGKAINPALNWGVKVSYTGSEAILMSYLSPGGYWQNGWDVICAMNTNHAGILGLVSSGAVTWMKNFTYPTVQSLLPWTRGDVQGPEYVSGNLILYGLNQMTIDAINCQTGAVAWSTKVTTPYGDGKGNPYDEVAASLCKYLNINGQIIIGAFGGDIWDVNATNGNTIWYTNTTTLMGPPGIETPYDVWPIWSAQVSACMDNNVVYLNICHEYNPPMFHGAQVLAINMTNGALVWKELSFPTMPPQISSGVLTMLNGYDNQVYAYGKGPSATTVNAQAWGDQVAISGSVTDVSAGATQSAVAKNYPNGLPCVSDASQSQFMEHVYQYQVMPSNATGVQVTISVLDSNGNFRDVGTTTSDASGFFSFMWKPDIPGTFTVYASFAGSNSYYGSSAEAVAYAHEATTAPTTQPHETTGLATTNDLMLGIGVIAVIIVIIGALIMLMLRKRP